MHPFTAKWSAIDFGAKIAPHYKACYRKKEQWNTLAVVEKIDVFDGKSSSEPMLLADHLLWYKCLMHPFTQRWGKNCTTLQGVLPEDPRAVE